MDYTKSSATAKTALGFGIAGTALGVIDWFKEGRGRHGGYEGRDGYGHGYGPGYGPVGPGYGGYGWFPGSVEYKSAYGCCGHERGRHEGHEPGVGMSCYVTEKELKLVREIDCEKDKVAKLEAEKWSAGYVNEALSPVHRALGEQAREIDKLQLHIVRLEDKLACCCKEQEHAVKDVYRWADCNFLPQEKGYMDGRHVNYHGVKPELILDPRFNDDNRRGRGDFCCEEKVPG